MVSLQLMTNRQNQHANLTKGRSLIFFSLHRLSQYRYQFRYCLLCSLAAKWQNFCLFIVIGLAKHTIWKTFSFSIDRHYVYQTSLKGRRRISLSVSRIPRKKEYLSSFGNAMIWSCQTANHDWPSWNQQGKRCISTQEDHGLVSGLGKGEIQFCMLWCVLDNWRPNCGLDHLHAEITTRKGMVQIYVCTSIIWNGNLYCLILLAMIYTLCQTMRTFCLSQSLFFRLFPSSNELIDEKPGGRLIPYEPFMEDRHTFRFQ